MVTMRHQLEGEQVSRFMTTDLVTVPRQMPVDEFVEQCVFHHRFTYYPVVDEDGRMVGLMNARAPGEVERARWPEMTVGELMRRVDDVLTLKPQADAVDVLSELRQREEPRAVIVQDGRPVGIISLRDLLQFLALKIDLAPRRRRL
jgi:CBS domain-containing protein